MTTRRIAEGWDWTRRADIGVAFVCTLLEFAGSGEQPADARPGVGPVEREAERLRHVPRELMRDHDPVDLGEVGFWVELLVRRCQWSRFT
jgi:hypothetical protein